MHVSISNDRSDPHRVDVYMRRKDLLEYILGRVTKGNANFFDDHVVTNTEVIKARYIKERCKFEVRTRNVKTGVENNIQYFDKCLWAAGDMGFVTFPRSSSTKYFGIVLIGGGFSAEDLALQAVKVGVNHVTIVVRDAKGGEVANTRYWPYDKVNVLRGMMVTGSEGERRIRLSESGDLPEVDESKGCFYLDDIETIILCTGYIVNQNMLSMENTQKLRRDFGDMEEELLLPDDWKMDHPLDKITGDTEPDAGYYSPRTSPDYYNGVSMTNPNMMFMSYNNFWWPLLAIDVYANILAGVCCGTVKLPTLEDARRQNYEESLRQMRNPLTRYYMDDEYYYPFQKFDKLTMDSIYHANDLFDMEAFDEKMKLANYPVRFIKEGGLQLTFDDIRQCLKDRKLPPGLTNAGRIFYLMGVYEKLHRRGEENEDIQNKEKHPLTYRDYTNGQNFYSMYTGTRARPSLESLWLSL
ncbi:hypothetical protein THAOC_09357 [Thalassiosira oceanica]|uniref:FAD/NAD(P)-binding domain-containing protein n=1 Tax=Thalassiosira oceanica TaxID=159749 RepID=K0TFT6_THAOC|nr:hypothetical protein THAOC_09357 [Thalassiosira oceanica]|eukprot:EJK69392.1 hypothetical protein THAOC_09357 [Thalassiosira oceanica]